MRNWDRDLLAHFLLLPSLDSTLGSIFLSSPPPSSLVPPNLSPYRGAKSTRVPHFIHIPARNDCLGFGIVAGWLVFHVAFVVAGTRSCSM